MTNNAITDVSGIRVGHYTDLDSATGCTVVLCEDGAVGGVDVRGPSPGTRETDLLRPTSRVIEAHAILLSGGSAYGLDAASGVMRFLEERGTGLKVGDSIVPIVPAAILFDLGMITNKVRPGPDEGYAACQVAQSGLVAEGTVGAGTGASVAGFMGREHAIKGGTGTASIDLGGGLIVGAIVAVNAIGGVNDPETGEIVAGPRKDYGVTMQDAMKLITSPEYVGSPGLRAANTTIGVVATNAKLNKEQANKLASAAQDGLALAVRPAHLMGDGDTMFALATGDFDDDVDIKINKIYAAAVQAVSRAIVRGIRKATGLGGVPAVSELGQEGVGGTI